MDGTSVALVIIIALLLSTVLLLVHRMDRLEGAVRRLENVRLKERIRETTEVAEAGPAEVQRFSINIPLYR
jgi:hypothetical protein